jgi:branched-chain amino acid transport system permease protein
LELLLSGQLFFSALVTGAVYVLIGLGLNLVFGTMRLLNIAHGEMAMIGAYLTYWLFTVFGVSPLISMPLAAALTAALGAAVYKGIFRNLLASNLTLVRLEANSLLVFLGISIILQNSATLLFTGSPRAYQYMDTILHIGGVAVTQNRLLVLIVAAVIAMLITLFLRFNIYGLAINAFIQNRQAAMMMGVNVQGMQLIAFCVGFGSAGLAGALLSMLEQISPYTGFSFTIIAFVMVILGGLGNILGGMVAGLLLGILETYGVAFTSPSFQLVLIYGVFVLVLIFRPEGLAGMRRRL